MDESSFQVFEIAVDRQTRTHDKNFEGGPLPPTGARGAETPIFGHILPNHLNMPKTETICALFVASVLRNSYMNFIQIAQIEQKWLSYDMSKKTICLYLGIRTKFDRFWPNSKICLVKFRIWPPNFFGNLNRKYASTIRSKFSS